MFDAVKIRIRGSLTFVANYFIFHNINIYKPRYNEGYVTFFVKSKDKNKVIDLLKQKFNDYKIIEDTTINNLVVSNLKRIGLSLGLLVITICLYVMSNCTVNLDIKGNEIVPTDTIKEVVLDFYEIPNFNKKLDTRKLVNNLIMLDGIASASVDKRGNTVFIEVYEELPKVPIIDKTTYKDVVSAYDGIITRMISYSGTPLKKVGDTVKCGDVLIKSKIALGEELSVDTYANGEVYGRVCIKKETIIPEMLVATKRTGRKIEINKFFGVKPKNPKVPFEHYEVELCQIKLDNTLCLLANKYVYYELEEVLEPTNFKENESFYVKEYTDKYITTLPSDCVFLRSWYNVKLLDKKVCLVIYYEIETKIT
ncbi:MAG: sporulation protein YqfD [Clostridia bacterium]